jgi:hypothetical protein
MGGVQEPPFGRADPQQQEARKRIDAGETQRSVARSHNVSQSTISRLAIS